MQAPRHDAKYTMRDVIKACLSFERDFFSLSQIVKTTGYDRQAVRHKLWKLENAGLLTRVSCFETRLPGLSNGRPTKEICYRNTKLLKEKLESPPQRQENNWDKMWKTVRALRKFTHSDLETICGISFGNVRFFVKRYRRFGFFRALGKKGRETVWGLVKDPGARRPLKAVKDSGPCLPAGRQAGMTEKAEVRNVD